MTKKTSRLTRPSTLFLHTGVSIISLGVLALCIYLLPLIWTEAYKEWPQHGYAVRAVVAAMYISIVPFYLGIYNGWRILDAIDNKQAFSLQPVKALKAIAYCAGSISCIYALSLPFFYIWADNTDAPGLMLIGLFLTGMPLIIGVAMSLLQRLLAEAVTIKSENDLTV